MIIKEVPPRFIPRQSHPLNLRLLKRIHRDTPHKTYMHAESAMHAGAREADEDAEFGGRPLWGGCPAVAAAVVGVRLLNIEELDMVG